MFSFLFAAQSPRLIYDVERGLDANESIMTSFRTDFRSFWRALLFHFPRLVKPDK